MNFDENGRRVSSFVTPELKISGVTPEVMQELKQHGIWNTSIKIVVDMTASTENTNRIFEILLRMLREKQ